MALNREDFNYGIELEEKYPKLIQREREFFKEAANNINRRCEFVVSSRDPQGTPDASGNIESSQDVNYIDGTIWIKQTGVLLNNKVYIKTETKVTTSKTALWVKIGN